MNTKGLRPTGRVFITRDRRKFEGSRVHLQTRTGTRCGQMANVEKVSAEADGVNCRMCLRCIDTDAGLRYTR